MDYRRACYYLYFLLNLWMNNFIHANKYNIRELCDVQDGSVRLSLEQGDYVQLNMEVDLDGPGTNCEIVIQSTHKDDGLLVYFEHFDFVGSNFATVFRRQACGTSLLRMMDGEIHYLSSCIGGGLANAPPMSTYSSLGAVRLQLLPANLTLLSRDGSPLQTTLKPSSPITFSVIATASQKSIVTSDCPSGCCREPYMFKCPLLNYCIDVKLTCNNVTNCGPRVDPPRDENGALCNNVPTDYNSNEKQGIYFDNSISDSEDGANSNNNNNNNNNNMLRPVWSQGTESEFGDIGNTEVPQAFYTRVELVCGIVSIALFCLAGIGVLVCKVRTNPQSRPRANSSRRGSAQSAVYVINESSSTNNVTNSSHLPASSRDNIESTTNTDNISAERTEAGSSSSHDSRSNSVGAATTIITSKPKYFAINCEYCRTYDNESDSNYSVYIMDMDGRLHYPQCPKSTSPAPPSYESLFPKHILFPNH